MKIRCTPRLVKNTYKTARSWRRAEQELNQLFGVKLSHLTWRDYAVGRRDITDPKARDALLLGPRPCPTCGGQPGPHFAHLLSRLNIRDLKHWHELRRQNKYREAKHFLDEVYSRSIRKRRSKDRDT